MSAELYQTIKNAVGNGYQAIKNTIEPKLVLIGTSAAVGLGAILYSPPAAADVNLPEPRFVQDGVKKIGEVGGKEFTKPKVIDGWKELQEQTAEKVKSLINTSNYDHFYVYWWGLQGSNDVTECAETKREWVKGVCHPTKSGGEYCSEKLETVCAVSYTHEETKFSTSYDKMAAIHTGGWLLFDDDNVFFVDSEGEGKEFSFDIDNWQYEPEKAKEVVELLKDLRFIALHRKYDGREYPLLQEVVRAEEEYKRAQEQHEQRKKLEECVGQVFTKPVSSCDDPAEKKPTYQELITALRKAQRKDYDSGIRECLSHNGKYIGHEELLSILEKATSTHPLDRGVRYARKSLEKLLQPSSPAAPKTRASKKIKIARADKSSSSPAPETAPGVQATENPGEFSAPYSSEEQGQYSEGQ